MLYQKDICNDVPLNDEMDKQMDKWMEYMEGWIWHNSNKVL